MKVIFFLVVSFVVAGCASTTQQGNNKLQLRNAQKTKLEYLSLGEWRLGDSRQKIREMPSLPNLKSVEVTGGFETQEAIFEGKKRNISFVFDDDKLVYSQVWIYEGRDLEIAINEFKNLFNFFSEELHGARISGIEASGGLSEDTLIFVTKQLFTNVQNTIIQTNSDSDEEMTFIMTLDLIPIYQPAHNKLHGKFVYSGVHETFYVFLFEDLPSSPSRTSSTQFNLSKK